MSDTTVSPTTSNAWLKRVNSKIPRSLALGCWRGLLSRNPLRWTKRQLEKTVMGGREAIKRLWHPRLKTVRGMVNLKPEVDGDDSTWTAGSPIAHHPLVQSKLPSSYILSISHSQILHDRTLFETICKQWIKLAVKLYRIKTWQPSARKPQIALLRSQSACNVTPWIFSEAPRPQFPQQDSLCSILPSVTQTHT